MAEGFFGKVKRNAKRAFDFSSDERIRRNRDLDETSSNLDFMLSRGKKRTSQDQSGTDAGQRIHKAPIIERELNQRKTNLEDAGISGGLASNAIKSGKVDYSGVRGHFEQQAAATPAVKLFKRLGKKKQAEAEV